MAAASRRILASLQVDKQRLQLVGSPVTEAGWLEEVPADQPAVPAAAEDQRRD